MAEELAMQGFNILILSSQKYDLAQIKTKVDKATNNGKDFREHLQYSDFRQPNGNFVPPTFEFECLECDFTKLDSIAEFETLIDERDIGMVVVDANYNLMAPFKDLTDTEL